MKSLLLLVCFFATQIGFSAIYEKDERHEVHELAHDPFYVKAAKAVAIVTRTEHLKKIGNRIEILGQTFAEYQKEIEEPLCERERFQDQHTPHDDVGSGFLVGPWVAVTAGHVIESDEDCKEKSFIFDVNYSTPDKNPKYTTEDKVFKCERLLHYGLTEDPMTDFAVVLLDRPVVPTVEPLPLQQSTFETLDTFMIGHPMGLPAKVTLEGPVTDQSDQTFFTHTLDTFSGNSGSPVFDSKTRKVVGILVEGETADITLEGEWPEGCWYSKVYCADSSKVEGCDSTEYEGSKSTRNEAYLGVLNRFGVK